MSARRLLLDELLLEQRTLRTPVVEFAEQHESGRVNERFAHLLPLSKPAVGEQYAFEVNLDSCTGCKACVVACHSLNGLDDQESWRDVGMVVSEATASVQTVTTACHHCADPACANGCPVLAYEKHEDTGIVQHLDDQCIGCSYCQMKCPYDVPKWNVKRGIVRKCDMCQGRLAVGEAPACVQACPNGAIKITLVANGSFTGERLVPGAFESNYTKPSTRYIGELEGRPVDSATLRVEPAHSPLAWMLVLTQFSVGLLAWMLWTGLSQQTSIIAALAGITGIGLSTAHLGQPLKAWRAFLGWRKSWLSREILAFGSYSPLLIMLVVTQHPLAHIAAVSVGLVALACSIMVYVDTRRCFWSLPLVSFKFIGAAAALGGAYHGFLWGGPLLTVIDSTLIYLSWKNTNSPWHLSARVLMEKLSPWRKTRLALTLSALVLPMGWILAILATTCERIVFFKAVVAPRMPGN